MKEQIDDIRYLGGIFVDIEEGFKNADFTKTVEAFFPVLEQSHAKGFQEARSSAGDNWPALAPSTVKRKGHDTILVDTGRLKQSLASQTQHSVREVSDRGRGALFGTQVPYSIFHQQGGGRLPQRQHVGITNADEEILSDRVADFAVESLKAKA
ncbi:phage virion morphogenesis protein [Rubinisphaera brasiliensis]|uniref:phage virion morphogenesis protein n=1 Tax=Rubinisphaera brasiliensis TaxID=119 RepID=UPI00145E8336|nr:phage virion morphogenesis protein [Rubinisphaera brasiliensis]